MKFEEFVDEVYTILGDNMTEVELSEKDIQVAVNRAIRTFKQKGPDNYRHQFYCFKAMKGTKSYIIPKEIHTPIKIIRPDYSWFSVEDPLALAAYNNLFSGMGSTISGTGDWMTIDLLSQQMETWKRYTAHDVDFDHDKLRSTLTLAQPPRRNEVWYLEVYCGLTEEEYLEQIWIQNWAISEAKKILGAAYRKFPNLPSPDGGTVSLGGDQLIQEAGEEQRFLLEDIDNLISGDVDFYGVYLI